MHQSHFELLVYSLKINEKHWNDLNLDCVVRVVPLELQAKYSS